MKPVKTAELADAINEVMGSAAPTDDNIPAGTQSNAGTGLRILVADDSPINQEVARGLLELLGHEAVLADDGRVAVELYQDMEIDAALMDIEMPEMDGLTATRVIRDREASLGLARLPIYALSAHASQEFADKCTAAGMDGHIAKPIQPGELADILESVASKQTAN